MNFSVGNKTEKKNRVLHVCRCCFCPWSVCKNSVIKIYLVTTNGMCTHTQNIVFEVKYSFVMVPCNVILYIRNYIKTLSSV